ncbi:DUF4139 domain-containing protein [Neogemmobacter tilapiae]|uniref:Mucoidy inhibitor MuiA family protein n=1 Tax=Neogemmobacter tilapiae TaxID=875041 RepID=A0A918WIR1_9RHOB|nr:DUF4139 domain-containing protein [Gemmobacter tilapiae]GHC55379.1 hypothetical protein GCM10007315_17870 [Gemmobacter tilapiae]
MTRHFMALLLLTAAPVQAETIMAPANLTHVTLYPQGASVERVLTIDLPPGQHDLLIPGLPLGVDSQALDVRLSKGLVLGSSSLMDGRLPPDTLEPSAQIKAAEEAVKAAEADLRKADAAIATIRARGDAAREQVAALRSMVSGDAMPASPEAAAAMAAMVGRESLIALEAAQKAEAEAVEAEVARMVLQEALDQAIAGLEALTLEQEDGKTLALSVESTGGPATIEIVTLVAEAGWQPAYDFRLTTEPAAMTVERAMLVSQYSGEDWRDVTLTLSTATPYSESAPGSVWPWLLSIYKDEPQPEVFAADRALGGALMMEEPAPVVASEAASPGMAMDWKGATVEYTYPRKVTVRDQSDQLRLNLDQISMDPQVFALAVPMNNDRGFVMAKVTNTGKESLLPGTARYYRDGALVGGGYLDLLAAGDDVELGFGPLNSLIVTREIPARNEGERGVFTTATERSETAVIRVENQTGRTWPLVVRDRVPYSEQEDLEISYQATPVETQKDMDGQRGVLEWSTDLENGASFEIQLDHTVRWPEGMILQ